MTLCLAFDCTGDACSIALVRRPPSGGEDRVVAVRIETMERGHAARLAPLIEETLAAASVAGADVDLLATTVGPGSFTGVRIGLALGRGLSLGWRKPLAGTTTLDALLAAAGSAEGTLVAAIDSKRGDWYAQVGRAGGSPSLVSPEALSETLRGAEARIVGPDAATLAGTLRLLGVEASGQSTRIDPRVVARLALDAGVAAWSESNRIYGRPAPVYVRGADVTLAGGVRTTA